jgi:hypothetical protein
MSKITLLQENRFGPRKRGSNTIPAKIFHEYKNTFGIMQTSTKINKIINFYRMPSSKIFHPINKLLFTYSKSKEELIKNNQFFEKTRFLYLRYNNKIYSNGFYYSKYYNMNYYPRYFFKIENYLPDSRGILKYKYGIYNRDECNDLKEIFKFLENNKKVQKDDILIFGNSVSGFKCTNNQEYFFNSIETYLVNNENNDCVSNTLLEAIYYKKKLKLLNSLAIANDNKALLESLDYFGYDIFFSKLENLNNYCWMDLNTDNFKERSKYINKLLNSSKTFIEFLNNF